MRPYELRPPVLGFGVVERLLGAVAGDLGEVRDALEPAAGAGGLAFADRHRQLPKISMWSPGASDTIARFCPVRVPQVPVRRFRLRLPERFSVFTLVTLTLKIASIGLLDLDLVRVGGDDERVDVLVVLGVGLLRHDGPQDRRCGGRGSCGLAGPGRRRHRSLE